LKGFGSLLVILGIGSIVLHFTKREFRPLAWIDTWGNSMAWVIRAGPIVLGLALLAMGKKSKSPNS